MFRKHADRRLGSGGYVQRALSWCGVPSDLDVTHHHVNLPGDYIIALQLLGIGSYFQQELLLEKKELLPTTFQSLIVNNLVSESATFEEELMDDELELTEAKNTYTTTEFHGNVHGHDGTSNLQHCDDSMSLTEDDEASFLAAGPGNGVCRDQ